MTTHQQREHKLGNVKRALEVSLRGRRHKIGFLKTATYAGMLTKLKRAKARFE